MGIRESYELYMKNEDQSADSIPFHDYCRWWCMINGVDQHYLEQYQNEEKHLFEQWGCQSA